MKDTSPETWATAKGFYVQVAFLYKEGLLILNIAIEKSKGGLQNKLRAAENQAMS